MANSCFYEVVNDHSPFALGRGDFGQSLPLVAGSFAQNQTRVARLFAANQLRIGTVPRGALAKG